MIPEIGQFTTIRRRPALVRVIETFKESRSGQELHMVEVEYIDGYEYPSDDKIIWEREVGDKAIKILDYPEITKLHPDPPTRFDSFIDAITWSLKSLYSMSPKTVF